MLDQGNWAFYEATEEPVFPGKQAVAGLWKILQRLLPLYEVTGGQGRQ